MTQLLKAKPIRELEIEKLRSDCDQLKSKGIEPFLKILLVGNDPASQTYTRNKKKFCEKYGAKCEIINLDDKITKEEFVENIHKMTTDKKVHGCFVQLPLPSHLQEIEIDKLIPSNKDVDGFHLENIGGLLAQDPKALIPCTPKGIMTLLKHYNLEISGKNAVVIGRSLIVGKPIAALLTNAHATVTICHSKTKNMHEITKRADIIVVAIGKKNFLTKDYISDKKEQVIIDVGINYDKNGKLFGDVDFDAVKDGVAAITPVPGGIGPLTILSLSQNLLQAAKNQL